MKIKWPEWVAYFAIDKDGSGYFHKDKPIINTELCHWHSDRYSYVGEFMLDGFDWKQTLLERPKQQYIEFTEVKKQEEL